MSCYLIQNCSANPPLQYLASSPVYPGLGTVISVTNIPMPPGVLNCWTVMDIQPECGPSAKAITYTVETSCRICVSAALNTCYLLEPCDKSQPSIIANNDLSAYLGEIITLCGDGSCKCYTVTQSQTCEGAVTIPNPSGTILSCNDCVPCDCPDGYTRVGDNCQKIANVSATPSKTLYPVVPGKVSSAYGFKGTNFYPNITTRPFPIQEVGGQFQDALTNVVTPVATINTPGTVWHGWTDSRLNTVGVWAQQTGASAYGNWIPMNEWIGFTQCITLPETKTYCIGFGADNRVLIKLDGAIIYQSTDDDTYNFDYWHVLEINLTQGFHVLEIDGQNTGLYASFGAEIYNATSLALQAITTVADLQAVTIFSTYDKLKGVFDVGQDSGYVCPPGSTYTNCGDGPSCTTITTQPYLGCAKTYKVVDCDGIQPDYITNDDLSAYLNNGYYKLCITASEPQIWPVGCYCVSVQVADTATGHAVTGTFGANFKTCPDCKRICYLLTDCKGVAAPIVVTGATLANCVGGVVKLKDCDDVCWNVTLADTCEGCVREVVVTECYTSPSTQKLCDYIVPLRDYTGTASIVINGVTHTSGSFNYCDPAHWMTMLNSLGLGTFTYTIVTPGVCPTIKITVSGTESYGNISYVGAPMEVVIIEPTCVYAISACDICNPAPAPVVPDLKAHMRPVMPGYKMGPCACPPEYYDKVSCNFADQVYDKMLSDRYGLEICCGEDDLQMWDIKKELLDLKGITDCYDLIKKCTCYTLHQFAETVTYKYISCEGCLSYITVEEGQTQYICSQSYPRPTCVVENAVSEILIGEDCTATGVCLPPPCYCYIITVPSGPHFDLGATNAVISCNGVTTVLTNLPAGDNYYCSDKDPQVSPGLTITKLDDCSKTPCVKPPCFCYTITNNVPDGAMTITYKDCLGVNHNVTTHASSITGCAQEGSVRVLEGQATITGGTNPCENNADCLPCQCYVLLTTDAEDVTYTDCNGVQSTFNLPYRTGLYLCAKEVITAGRTQKKLTTLACTSEGCDEQCSCLSITNPDSEQVVTVWYLGCENQLLIATINPGTTVQVCGKLNSVLQQGTGINLTVTSTGSCPCPL